MSNETSPVTPVGFPILVLFSPYTVVSWNGSSVPDVSWLNAGAAMASMATAPIVPTTTVLLKHILRPPVCSVDLTSEVYVAGAAKLMSKEFMGFAVGAGGRRRRRLRCKPQGGNVSSLGFV